MIVTVPRDPEAKSLSLMTRFVQQLDSNRITIKVGEDESLEEFRVPKDLLCARSKFFANALKNDRFVEAQSGSISLPDDSPAAFEAFVYWLHTGYLAFDDWPVEGERRNEELILCFEIFTFGNKYCLPGIQNPAMHRACCLMNDSWRDSVLPVDVLTTCFMTTTEGSEMRLLIADYVVDRRLRESKDGKPSLVLDSELEDSAEFQAALSESEGAYEKLGKNDFPRSKKPAKSGEDLYVEDDEGDNEISYFTRWKAPMRTCEDCGYLEDDVAPHCAQEKDVHCTCEVVLRCSDCGKMEEEDPKPSLATDAEESSDTPAQEAREQHNTLP